MTMTKQKPKERRSPRGMSERERKLFEQNFKEDEELLRRLAKL